MKRTFFPFAHNISISSRNAMEAYRARQAFQGQFRKPGSKGYTESGQAVTSAFLSLLT